MEAKRDKIELVFLPAYNPDLNPDEHFNADLKQGIRSKFPVRTKSNLKNAAEAYLRMLQASPARIEKYFNDPAIRYASAKN